MKIFSTIKKLLLLLDKTQKRRLLRTLLITIFGSFFEMMGVTLMIPLISAIVTPEIIVENEHIAYVCRLFDLHSHRTFVLLCILALILIYIIKNVFLMVEYYANTKFAHDNKFIMQKKLLHSFLYKPYEYFLNTSSGEILRVINSDVEQTYNILFETLYFFSESFVSFVLILTVIFVDPSMTLTVAALLIISVLIISKFIKPKLQKKGAEFRNSASIKYNWLLQSINGIKEIKITNKESYFENNFEIYGNKQVNAEKMKEVYNNTPKTLIELSCICSTLIVIAFQIYFGRDIATLIPTLGAFAMASVKLMPSANRIVNLSNDIAFSGPLIDDLLLNIKDMEVSDYSYINNHSLKVENCIELKNIKYAYPNSSSYVLDDASMKIPIGFSVGIVGKSGVGKTTTVDILLGLLKVESGEILLNGKNIFDDYGNWLSHIGYIPQTIFMLDDSIKANVAFGNVPDDDKVRNALELAQLADFIDSLPEGMNTKVGEQGIRLSGGQRQRIGIARALYENPEILVFDEATSSLDNETEKAIIESINSLHGFKTMVIIAHRLQTIENCDIIYRVSNGKINLEKSIEREKN